MKTQLKERIEADILMELKNLNKLALREQIQTETSRPAEWWNIGQLTEDGHHETRSTDDISSDNHKLSH